MAATVAHEINNPLEAVTNILYLLENSAQLDDSAREFVRAAQTELKRISQITKLTLGFHRGSESRQTPVKIMDLIDDALTLYERKAMTLGIAVNKRYHGTGVVHADPGELRQTFPTSLSMPWTLSPIPVINYACTYLIRWIGGIPASRASGLLSPTMAEALPGSITHACSNLSIPRRVRKVRE